MILVHAVVSSVRREEDDRREEAQEHDDVSRQVDEESSMLEERQIQILINHLPGRGLLRLGTYYAKITSLVKPISSKSPSPSFRCNFK